MTTDQARQIAGGDTVYKVNANPQDIIPNGTKGAVLEIGADKEFASVNFEGYGSKVVVVRCLSLAATREPEPPAGDTVHVYPAIDKQGYDILTGGKLDKWKYDKGDAFEYALVFANDNIRALQAENAALKAQLAASESEKAELREALKPFADAYKEIPEGLRSTLRIWDGEGGIVHLSATTDHMEAATAALATFGADTQP